MKRMTRLTEARQNEKGFSLVFVGCGMLAFVAVSMLAIDVGMLMTSRNQAQNSADSGALAGAIALAVDSWTDRSASGPAVTNALAASRANQVMRATVAVAPVNVEFLNNPDGVNNRVRVTVFRDAVHGNPLSTLIAKYFGIATANISAVATAEASPANAETCVKPFTIPDRWLEGGTRGSTGEDAFTPGTDVYQGPWNADGSNNPNYTGYNAVRDKGVQITLKANNDTKIAPSFYYPWDMPGENRGADDYRWSIGNCKTDLMKFGDVYDAEPGNMVGPTKQGMGDLVAKDPDAYWDTTKNEVHSSMRPSPRVVVIPLFDPVYYYTGKMNGRNASLKFVNYLGFFLERMNGNEVVGRITPVAGVMDRNAGPAPAAAFPYVIRLVQ
jgi:Flp pilus assembly protein TadG